MCHQELRGVEDAPPHGFMCGGVKCRKTMTAPEKQMALAKNIPAMTEVPPQGESSTSQP